MLLHFSFYVAVRVFSWKKTPILIFTSCLMCGCVLLLPATENWGKFQVEPKIFSCTLKKEPGSRLGPMEIMLIAGFGLAAFILMASNAYIQYKTRIRYIHENDANIAQNVIETRVRLESQISKTSLIIMITFVFLHFPGNFPPISLKMKLKKRKISLNFRSDRHVCRPNSKPR